MQLLPPATCDKPVRNIMNTGGCPPSDVIYNTVQFLEHQQYDACQTFRQVIMRRLLGRRRLALTPSVCLPVIYTTLPLLFLKHGKFCCQTVQKKCQKKIRREKGRKFSKLSRAAWYSLIGHCLKSERVRKKIRPAVPKTQRCLARECPMEEATDITRIVGLLLIDR